jgi:hypothetical protein
MSKIIKYRIVSTYDDNFVRDIEIEEDKTFMDLHLAIQSACNYDPSLLTTFFLSNKNWDKLQEISAECIDPEAQKEVMLMDSTKLSKFNPVVGQRYIYIFDFFSVRAFFIEIVNIREKSESDEKLEFPICTLSHGNPPEQVFVDDITEDDIEGEGFYDIDDDLYDDFNEYGYDNLDDY